MCLFPTELAAFHRVAALCSPGAVGMLTELQAGGQFGRCGLQSRVTYVTLEKFGNA